MNAPFLPRPLRGSEGVRSRWSKWLWLLSFVLTFTFAYSIVGLGTAVLCTAAMLASAGLQSRTGSPFRARRVTISSFWFLSYLVMIFFPAFFVYADHPGPYRGSFLFAVTATLVTVPIGLLLASYLWKFRPSETEEFFCRPIERSSPRSGVPLPFVVLLGVGLLLTILYLREVETVPIFYLLRHPGDYFVLSLLREESFKLLNSSFDYAFFLARSLLFPFLIVLSFGYFISTHKKQWLAAFAIALLSGLFFASLTIAKAPVAAIFVIMGLFFYYYRRGSFGYKSLILFTVFVFGFPVFVIAALGSHDTSLGAGSQLLVILQAVIYRLLYVPADVVYYYYEFFPAQMHHLHGGSIHMLSSLFGLHFVNTASVVGQYAEPGGMESVSYNGGFMGDLHADFGVAGVLIGGILAGVIMQAFHIYLVRRGKTVCNVATYSFLVYTFWFLNSVSLPVVLASDGAVLVLALLWLFDSKARWARLPRHIHPSPAPS